MWLLTTVGLFQKVIKYLKVIKCLFAADGVRLISAPEGKNEKGGIFQSALEVTLKIIQPTGALPGHYFRPHFNGIVIKLSALNFSYGMKGTMLCVVV